MAIFLGASQPATYKLGATAVSKIYLGGTQVWPTGFAITQQPKNNFSATYNQNAAFSVTATGLGALSYQWQGYYYDYNTGNYGWNDISGATAATLSLSGSSASNYGIDPWSTGGMMQLRVVVTDAADSSTLTSQTVRWVDYSVVYPYGDSYGNSGSYWSGSTSVVGGVTYSDISLQEDETVNVTVYDNGYSYFDTSWYSSNAFTVKLQRSLNATTWTDVETYNYRAAGFFFGTTLAAQYGVIYYRVLVIGNWPLTATNGTQSATRTPHQIIAASYRLEWPALTSKIYATYLGLDAMTTQSETNIVDTYLGADVMTTQNVTNIVDTYLGADVMATQNVTNIVDTYLGADVMATQNVTNIVDTYLGADVMATQRITNIVDTYCGFDVLCTDVAIDPPPGIAWTSGQPGGTVSVNVAAANASDITDFDVSGRVALHSSLVADGYTLSYQWQSRASVNASWTNLPINTSAPHFFPASDYGFALADNNKQYRCVISTNAPDVQPVRTANYTLQVTAEAITFATQPAAQNVVAGDPVTFSVAVDDKGTDNPGSGYYWGYAYVYQWQLSTNNGSTWSDMSGETSTTLSFTMTETAHGNKYRCRVSAPTSGVTANSAAAQALDPTLPPPVFGPAYGPEVLFTHSNGGSEVDIIISGALHITRQWGGGIYNSAVEGWFNSGVSPQDTVWNNAGWNSTCDYTTRTYDVLREAVGQLGNNIVNTELIMKHTPTGRYWLVKFSYWQQGGGGGFTYTRKEILSCG